MSKILIVEDEQAIADLEKDYLELSGFEVEVANDGQGGLERPFMVTTVRSLASAAVEVNVFPSKTRRS